MSTLNKKTAPIVTHEGARATPTTAYNQLRRTILSCMLFEDNFYEDGMSVVNRITSLIPTIDPIKVSKLCVEAREKMGLRHAPLMVIVAMAVLPSHKRYVSRLIQRVCTRPDQLTDLLALYWKDGKKPLSAKLKQGLGFALKKFNAFQIKKNLHNDRAIKMRDVMFLTHPKPTHDEQEALFKQIADNSLEPITTWETLLSAGADKKHTFEMLMKEGKLGALAFVRNLRNMEESKVDKALIASYSYKVDVFKIYPWQFIAAAKYAPWAEPMLEKLLQRSLPNDSLIEGNSIILVDVSGSMEDRLSGKSEMTRMDAACGLAILARELMEDCRIFSFSTDVVECPPRRGFALRDAIVQSQPHGGTELGKALQRLQSFSRDTRLIIITDEQASSGSYSPYLFKNTYVINVGIYQNGISYNHGVKRIDGFSSQVLKWLKIYEDEKTGEA